MIEQEKISVIVPIYNTAPWIAQCVGSIQAQTYENLEIILVNDGSTDNSRTILEMMAEKDSRIKLVDKENGGLPSARLAGMEAATGEWLTFVDGDDEIEPRMYQRLLDNARQYRADISHCGFVMCYPNGTRHGSSGSGGISIQDHYQGLRDLLEEEKIQPSVCTKLYKRSLFYGLEGKYTEEIWNNEDLLLNFYLFSHAQRSVYEDVAPYHYCQRDGSLSRRKPTAHTIYDPIKVKERILEDCPQELLPDLRRAMAKTCLFSYAQLCRGMEKTYAGDRKIVRGIIRQQLPYLSLLSRIQRIMVWVISYVPWAFALVYNFYYLFLKQEPSQG